MSLSFFSELIPYKYPLIPQIEYSEYFFRIVCNSYYNYIWDINKRIEDSEILNELPTNLLSDIQMERYYCSVKDSLLFKGDAGINLQLACSVFRLLKISRMEVAISALKGVTIIKCD